MLKKFAVAGAAVAIVLVACGGDGPDAVDDETTSSSAEPIDEPTLTTLPAKPAPTESPPGDPAEDPSNTVAEAEESARSLLKEMVDVSDDAIDTVVAERVVWSDGSMGCPQPGRSYTQSTVPGYRVVLLAKDKEYAFHGADGGPLTYCSNRSEGFNPDA